jgi:hypothetical protein
LCNLASNSVKRNPYVSSSIFTFNDFKLPKEGGLIFDRLGIKERTWAVNDASELV